MYKTAFEKITEERQRIEYLKKLKKECRVSYDIFDDDIIDYIINKLIKKKNAYISAKYYVLRNTPRYSNDIDYYIKNISTDEKIHLYKNTQCGYELIRNNENLKYIKEYVISEKFLLRLNQESLSYLPMKTIFGTVYGYKVFLEEKK